MLFVRIFIRTIVDNILHLNVIVNGIKKKNEKIRIMQILYRNERRGRVVACVKCNVVNQSDGAFTVWKYANNTGHFYWNYS